MAAVTRARLAAIWFAPYGRLLSDDPPSKGAPELGRSVSWRAAYLAAGAERARPYERPWPVGPSSGSDLLLRRLWNEYATGDSQKSLSSRAAWRHLVPLRLAERKWRLPAAPWRASVHECVYPHGVACVVDAELEAPAGSALNEFCADALELRWRPQRWLDDGNVRELTLDEVAYRSLRRLLRRLSGNRHPTVTPVRDVPFTIVTVIDGTGVQPAAQPPRREGYAMTHWQAGWGSVPPAAWATDTVLPLTHGRAAGAMVCTPGARFVWMPELFGAGTSDHTLGHFHRRMMWMSLQTDALGALARNMVADDTVDLSPTLYSLRKSVAGLFGRLQSGAGTVRLASIPQQITDSGYAQVAQLLRTQEQMTPLSIQ